MTSMRRFHKAVAAQFPLSTKIKGHALEVTYPGFFREETNSKGVLRPNQLTKILESTRFLSVNLLPPLADITDDGKMLVLLNEDIIFKPELHLMISGRTSEPYKITTKISSAGRSSVVLDHTLSKVDDNFPLIKCHTTLVYVDWFRRRPASLPAEVRVSVPQKEKGGEKLKLPEIPPESFSYEVEIQPSDMDANQHTNQSSYVRICSDTEYEAAAKSFYRDIHDVSALHFLRISILYSGESTAGDSLTVYTWQDINNIYDLKEAIPQNFYNNQRSRFTNFVDYVTHLTQKELITHYFIQKVCLKRILFICKNWCLVSTHTMNIYERRL